MGQDLAETKSKLPEAVTGRAETESSERPKKAAFSLRFFGRQWLGLILI
jgi:hypothetical protein